LAQAIDLVSQSLDSLDYAHGKEAAPRTLEELIWGITGEAPAKEDDEPATLRMAA